MDASPILVFVMGAAFLVDGLRLGEGLWVWVGVSMIGVVLVVELTRNAFSRLKK